MKKNNILTIKVGAKVLKKYTYILRFLMAYLPLYVIFNLCTTFLGRPDLTDQQRAAGLFSFLLFMSLSFPYGYSDSVMRSLHLFVTIIWSIMYVIQITIYALTEWPAIISIVVIGTEIVLLIVGVLFSHLLDKSSRIVIPPKKQKRDTVESIHD